MDGIWAFLGYTGKCGEDSFPIPGELIKQYRTQRNMSQEQLALELGCSRAMVARMEKENLGLSSIATRRNLAKILGIAPIMLGLVSQDEITSTKPTVLYDTKLLKRSLVLHREVYFSGGNIGGVAELEATVQQVFAISKSLNHKNKEILALLCHYGQLGIDIGREEQNYKAAERYGSWASSLAHKLNDQNLIASTLLRYCAAMYEKGDLKSAKQYADEALAQSCVPESLHGGVILEASKVYAKLGDPMTLKLLDKASSIARRNALEEDPGFVKLTPGFCHLRTARALFAGKDYTPALDALDMAEEQTSPNMARRRCAIQVLQAQILIEQSHFDDAAMCAHTALTLARTINSTPSLAYIATIYQKLKNSPFGTSRETIKLGKDLSQAVGTKKLRLLV